MRAVDRSEVRGGHEAARLAIFRLVPTTARHDRRFARDALHGEVVVRAFSVEDARQVASDAESEFQAAGASASDSPFHDETLYAVIEVPGVDFLRGGKRGLIAGRFASKPVAGENIP
jgi:predicted dinucleotide-binding enzyme